VITAHASWNAHPQSPDGFKLYVGPSTLNYTTTGSPKDMGNVTSGTFDLPGPGTYYFALTAYMTSPSEETEFSDEETHLFLDEVFASSLPSGVILRYPARRV
jgi:hypothetical protein